MERIGNKIRLTESEFNKLIAESVNEALRSHRYAPEMYADARDQFEQNKFEGYLAKIFPDRELEATCDEFGTITVEDLDTHEMWKVDAETEINYVPTGMPSRHNPYEEGEEAEVGYNFDKALNDVVAQIKGA